MRALHWEDSWDPEAGEAMRLELERQQKTLVLIASENYASPAVLAAQGSVLTNKYAEGLPGARYYQGCAGADAVERLAIRRAKELFGADHVNVQPHSGVNANLAAYYALMEPGDRILAMDLSHGGHLSHGKAQNYSGRFFKTSFYGVSERDGCIDHDVVRRIAGEVKPKLIVAGASSYSRQIDFARWADIAREQGSLLMADIAHIGGLVAAGLHPDPVPCADVVTATTHKTLRGPRGAMVMCKQSHAGAIDRAVFPGTQGGPLMHVIAAKAICFAEALRPEFRKYQAQVIANAQRLAAAVVERGYTVVSGGTDTHLFLIDLRGSDVTGRDAAIALERAGITANMNVVPFDERPPAVTSGVRFGTPAVTTRGMKEPEMDTIARLIAGVLERPADETVRKNALGEVDELCRAFPIYEGEAG